jgi:cell wall assembly regulator SMI1
MPTPTPDPKHTPGNPILFEPILFEGPLTGGRTTRLAPLPPDTLTCVTIQWQTLLAAGIDAGLLDGTAAEEAAAQLQDGTLGEGDTELLTTTPVWLTSETTCRGDGTCCDLTDLGTVLAQLHHTDDRDTAATAHLDAITHVADHLRAAASWLLDDEHLTTGTLTSTCVACVTHPYPHARTLETALSQLGQQLAAATVSWQLHVTAAER